QRQDHPGGDLSEHADHRRDRAADRCQGPDPPKLGERGPGNPDAVRFLREALSGDHPRAAGSPDVVVTPLSSWWSLVASPQRPSDWRVSQHWAFERVMVIVAHPDDAEPWVGGTLAMLAREGKTIS